MALLLLTVVRGDLMRNWRASLPPDAPNQFLVNVLPDQVDDARASSPARSAARRRFEPMVRGRLVAVNDAAVDTAKLRTIAGTPAGRARVQPVVDATRCRRAIACRRASSGQPATRAPTAGMSLEDGIAETLGVKLGDSLTFDIAGHRVSTRR